MPVSEMSQSQPQSAAADRAETEQEQSELDLGVISTGSETVDEALSPLEGLSDQSVDGHPAVFERVLGDLTATMTDGAPEAASEVAPEAASESGTAAPMVGRPRTTQTRVDVRWRAAVSMPSSCVAVWHGRGARPPT